MIIKKEHILFTVACLVAASFTLNSSDKESKTTLSPANYDILAQNDSEISSAKISFKKHVSSKRRQKSLTRSKLAAFKKKLINADPNQNLDSVIADFTKKQQEAVARKTAAKQAKTAIKNKAKKKVKKKKKVAQKKKPKPDVKKNEPTIANNEKVQKSDLRNVSSVANESFTNFINPSQRAQADNNFLSENEDTGSDEVATSAANATADTPTVSATNLTASDANQSIYTQLLSAGRFEEFEQLLKSNLNESQRVQSYTDSVKFLFTQSDQSFLEVDSFVRNQFLNDQYAVVIAKGLSNGLSTEQVNYSVGLLNQLVLAWNPARGPAQFRALYQDNVLSALPQNSDTPELFSSLQASVDARLLDLENNSVEVSSN